MTHKPRFEQAAVVRDQLRAIENVVARQRVISSDYVDSDVIAMARSNGEACMQVFFTRGGKLIGREYFLLEGTEETPDAGVMAAFIKQFYDEAPTLPEQVLLPHEVEEAQIITQWLNQKKSGHKVEIQVPRGGAQQELIQMAIQNAAETLAALQAQWQADTHRQEQALAELQTALELPEPPNRVECYDISNTQTSLCGLRLPQPEEPAVTPLAPSAPRACQQHTRSGPGKGRASRRGPSATPGLVFIGPQGCVVRQIITKTGVVVAVGFL